MPTRRLDLCALALPLAFACGRHVIPCDGDVTGREYRPEFTSLVMIPCGRSVCTSFVHHDAEYHLRVRVVRGESDADVEVNAAQYAGTHEGQRVELEYRDGCAGGYRLR